MMNYEYSSFIIYNLSLKYYALQVLLVTHFFMYKR
jgi:hypothetical protein